MMNVLGITAPLFTLMAVGFLAVKFKALSKEAVPGIARFVLIFCIPAIIVGNLSNNSPAELFNSEYVSIYAISAVVTFFISLGLIRITSQRGANQSSALAIGAAMPNSIFVGYPILLQVMPDLAAQVLVVCILVENLVVLPIALLTTEYFSADRKEKALLGSLVSIFKRLVNNPILIAVAVGLLISASGYQLPSFIDKSLDVLAKAAGGAALIVIGGSLVGNSIRDDLSTLGIIASAKLLIQPALALMLITLWWDFDRQWQIALMVITASPMLTIYPILAAPYGAAKTAASSLLLTTVVSYVTLNSVFAYIL
jgi:predicted permease